MSMSLIIKPKISLVKGIIPDKSGSGGGGISAFGEGVDIFLAFNGDNSGLDTEWYEPLGNLLLWSVDFTQTGAWENIGGTVVRTALTLQDDSASAIEGTQQDVSILNDSVAYTFVAKLAKDSDETRFPEFQAYVQNGTIARRVVQFNTATGASTTRAFTDGSHSVYDDGSNWVIAINLTNNSSGNTLGRMIVYPAVSTVFGSAEVSTQGTTGYANHAFLPGTHTAEEAAALYRKTEALQTVWDFTANLNHGVRGSAAGVDTNDPSYVVNASKEKVLGLTFDGVDDYISDLPALPATYTIVQVTDTQCDSIDSAGGKFINGASNVAGAVQDIRTAGEASGVICVHIEYDRVLSEAEQASVYNLLKTNLNANRALELP